MVEFVVFHKKFKDKETLGRKKFVGFVLLQNFLEDKELHNYKHSHRYYRCIYSLGCNYRTGE